MTITFEPNVGSKPQPEQEVGVLTTRVAKPSDAKAVGSIIFAAFTTLDKNAGIPTFYKDPTEAQIRAAAMINRDDVIGIVTVQDGKVFGIAFGQKIADDAIGIGPVAVCPTFQGSGVGTLMLNALDKQAGRWGTRQRLTQDAFNNCTLGLYLGRGFDFSVPIVKVKRYPPQLDLWGSAPRCLPVGGRSISVRLEAECTSGGDVAAFHRSLLNFSRPTPFAAWVARDDDGAVTGLLQDTASYPFAAAADDGVLFVLIRHLVTNHVTAEVRLGVPYMRGEVLRALVAEGFRQTRPLNLLTKGEGWREREREGGAAFLISTSY